MRRLLVLAVTAVALCTGCTGGDDPEQSRPSSTSTGATSDDAEGGASCDEIWKPGEVLAEDYGVCVQGGQAARQDETACDDGSRLIVFDDRLWAVTGQEIVEPEAAPLQDTPAYSRAFASCTGE